MRKGIRQFVPGRIRAIELTDDSFTRDETFDINNYLSGTMAVFRGDGSLSQRVRLRFTGSAVNYARERRGIRAKSLRRRLDGALELSFTVSHLREAERLVLTWAPDCEALAPEELRESVAKAFAEAAADALTKRCRKKGKTMILPSRRGTSYRLMRQVDCTMDKSQESNRELFNDDAVGDRFVFDRLKVKVDCLTDMPPGFFQSIPFGDATRKRRYIRGVTAFIGWFVNDSESHARSLFNGAAAQLDKPIVGLRMVHARPKTGCPPKLRIKQTDLPRPESRRSFRWSDAATRARPTQKAATSHAGPISWTALGRILARRGCTIAPSGKAGCPSGTTTQSRTRPRISMNCIFEDWPPRIKSECELPENRDATWPTQHHSPLGLDQPRSAVPRSSPGSNTIVRSPCPAKNKARTCTDLHVVDIVIVCLACVIRW